MKSIAELLTVNAISELASRSNFRFGKDIAKNGEITFTKSNTFNRIASVKNKNAPIQTVELRSTSKGLRFKCSCTARKEFFCEHCTAVALAMQSEETGLSQ